VLKNKPIELFTTEDGSHSLRVSDLDETYHSSHGALQESNHVFIKNGLSYWVNKNQSNELSIFEVGYGTGLNALLTAIRAKELNKNIFYQSIELYPLPDEITSQLNYSTLNASEPKLFNLLHSSAWEKPVVINNHFTIHKKQASFLHYEVNYLFDIIYFDAFAPSKQPEMWKYSIIEKCYHLLKPNGIFVTYSAKGQLKRDLKKAGFIVESLPGPPGKFEMVRAVKTGIRI